MEMLTFPAYLALGIFIMSLTGWLLVLARREGFIGFGKILSLMFFFFPSLYSYLVYSPFVYLGIGYGEIPPFISSLVTLILLLSMFVPVYLSELKGKRLSVGYLFFGSLICFWTPWLLSDLASLMITLTSGVAILAESGLVYRNEKRKEKLEKRCLSIFHEKGEVTILDVMAELGISDLEADKILYDLWQNKSLIEKTDKGTRTFYHIKT